MNLAIIYNAFDGLEHLPGSIRQIRPFAHRVFVIWEAVNWRGQTIDPADSMHLMEAADLGATLVPWKAVTNAFANEKGKRQHGIELARNAKCTHFLHMDADEYYLSQQFEAAMGIAEHYDSTACRIRVYYKQMNWALQNLDETYAPFIHRIQPHSLAGAAKYPVYADPTRRINPVGKFFCFGPETLLMHHMSWVRRDIESKITNSTAARNINNARVRQQYAEAEPGYYLREIHRDFITLAENPFA